jgi:hypothetical protein
MCVCVCVGGCVESPYVVRQNYLGTACVCVCVCVGVGVGPAARLEGPEAEILATVRPLLGPRSNRGSCGGPGVLRAPAPGGVQLGPWPLGAGPLGSGFGFGGRWPVTGGPDRRRGWLRPLSLLRPPYRRLPAGG